MARQLTFEEVLLVQRLMNNDYTAAAELWPLLFDGAVIDPKRPLVDVIKDLGDKIEEITVESDAKKTPSADEVNEALSTATDLLLSWLTSVTKPSKRKP